MSDTILYKSGFCCNISDRNFPAIKSQTQCVIICQTTLSPIFSAIKSLSDILQQAELGNYLSDILLQSLSDILQQAKLDNYQLSYILQHSKLRGC